MNGEWRVIEYEEADAYTNMATDEAILWARIEKLVPNTVRFFGWKPSAISIGFYQELEREVYVEKCRELGIDIVRRITGGGAVYHAEGGELTYSLVVDEEFPGIPKGFGESFRYLSQGIIFGLEALGVKAEFQPVNDLVVNGRKISGNAQTRRRGVILQHGTILLKTDLSTMFKVLRISAEKVSDKALKAAEERVTTIYREYGREIETDKLVGALKEGFREALGVVALNPSGLTEGEKTKMRELRGKYASKEWLYLR